MTPYKLYFDDTLLGSSLSEPGATFFNAVLTEQANAAGKLVFSLPRMHPELFTPRLLNGNVRVYRGESEQWRGRIVQTDVDIYGNRTFTCEGAMAYFGDIWYCCKSTEWADNELGIRELIGLYNKTASDWRALEVGELIGTHAIDEECSAAKWLHIQTLLKRFLSEQGGYMWMRGGYFNWYTSPQKSEQPCLVGYNLLSASARMDALDVYTRQCASYTFTPSGGSPVQQSAVNVAGTLTYGVICCEELLDLGDVGAYADTADGRAAAAEAAQAKLEEANRPGPYAAAELTVSATVFDRSLTDSGVEPFELGTQVKTTIPSMGIEGEWLDIKEIRTNLNSPEKSLLTLGGSRKLLSNRLEARYG